MSDTTTRPTPIIPGIMGWEPTPEEWGYIGAFNHPTGGYVITDDRQVTPDNMLAWLAERQAVEGIEPCSVGEERALGNRWSVWVWYQQGDEWLDDWIHAPTLHAALEQAVIAVGCAE